MRKICGKGLLDEPSKDSISLEPLTDQQCAMVELLLDRLEAHPQDEHRLRIVTITGRKGPWFSRFWGKIKWEQFWGICPKGG